MKSTRYKSRHISDEDLAAELMMRRDLRSYIRCFYPDIPRPKGQDWFFAESGIPCITCSATFRHVRVPGVDLPDLLVCPHCGTVSEHLQLG
jgi:hypothetical protein